MVADFVDFKLVISNDSVVSDVVVAVPLPVAVVM